MRPSVLTRGLGRAAAVLATAFALVTSAGPVTGVAHADSALSGSLVFGGDAGEHISGGQDYAYTANEVELFDVSGAHDENALSVVVRTHDGTRWYLHMAAPDGERLTSGSTYTGASRWPEAEPQDPELVFENGERWCDTSTGSFTISHISFGPYGYVKELDATFEQYCDGSTLPLRGEVHAVMPEPQPLLETGASLSDEGSVLPETGQAVVRGTVTCNKDARIRVFGLVRQTWNGETEAWGYETSVNCTAGAPVSWSATTVTGPAVEPFRRGEAEVVWNSEARDPHYPVTVETGQRTSTVELLARSGAASSPR